MNDRLDIDWNRVGKKWVACFDILGFREFVKDNDPNNGFHRWELCYALFRDALNQRCPELGFAYFSDTFLIYAPDDVAHSFGQIERCSRRFFQSAILWKFPLRGAMACDEFYADKPNGVFLGKALVDAYEHGQKFNWIGYTLCASVLSRLEELKITLSARHFRKYDAPVEAGREETVALLYGPGNGAEYISELEKMKRLALEDMARKQKDPGKIARVEAIYNNSIQFIERFEMAKPVGGPEL
jgi:hypothetical protein